MQIPEEILLLRMDGTVHVKSVTDVDFEPFIKNGLYRWGIGVWNSLSWRDQLPPCGFHAEHVRGLFRKNKDVILILPGPIEAAALSMADLVNYVNKNTASLD